MDFDATSGSQCSYSRLSIQLRTGRLDEIIKQSKRALWAQ